MYMKMRQTLIDRKNYLFPESKDLKARSEDITNFFYCFASNKPTKFGIYHQYYVD